MQNNQINYDEIKTGIHLVKSGIKSLQADEMKHINALNPVLVKRGNELLKQLENIESNITIESKKEILQIFAESLKLTSDHQKQVSLYVKGMEDKIKLSEKSLKNLQDMKDINSANLALLGRTTKLCKILEGIKYKTDLNQKILQEQIVDPLNQLEKEYVEAKQNSFANSVQQPQSNQGGLAK